MPEGYANLEDSMRLKNLNLIATAVYLLSILLLSACEPAWWDVEHSNCVDDECISSDTGPDLEDIMSGDQISLEEATEVAAANGVDPVHTIYAELLPYVVSDEHAELCWGFIERYGDDFLVTLVNRWTGDLVQLAQEPDDNILDFIYGSGLADVIPGRRSSTPNSYNSFPWNWRLPMEAGSFSLTCGYGCGSHKNSIYYSTDWANGRSGHLLESVASCWVINTTYTSGAYGHQVVAECGNAGGGKRYYYRVAHMKKTAKVSPGWWIGKGRDLGRIGSTGKSTGPHVHYEVGRASGVSASGWWIGFEDLPITHWPGAGDGICNGGLNSKSMYGTPGTSVTVKSNGCP